MSVAAISMFLNIITVFILAIFVGVEIINKVPSLLHTPLMSGSNAISGITVVGAILAIGLAQSVADQTLRLIVLSLAVGSLILATINVVGGFLVTHRMLQKFKVRK